MIETNVKFYLDLFRLHAEGSRLSSSGEAILSFRSGEDKPVIEIAPTTQLEPEGEKSGFSYKQQDKVTIIWRD